MNDKICYALEQFRMVGPGEKVLVALSGGADSTALLLWLKENSRRYQISVGAVHINHLLRGEDAMADEEFCKALCETWDIPFFCRRVDVAKKAKEEKKSLELAAREVRYEALEQLRKEQGYDKSPPHITPTTVLRLCSFIWPGAPALKGYAASRQCGGTSSGRYFWWTGKRFWTT